MKKIFKDKCNIAFLVLLICILINALYWGYRKEGFYGDEIYSYAFVCSTDEPSVNWGSEEEPYLNNWHDSDYFQDYFLINDDEAFDIIGVVKVIWGDDHPPMFDLILEILISLFSRNIFTKWIGLAINFTFFICTLIFLYLLGNRIFESRNYSLLATALYGFSIGGVSNCIYIRMYMMLTFATVAFTYANVLIIQYNKAKMVLNGKKKGIYAFLALITFFGMTTQYYFSVFCGFLCLSVFIPMVISKRWRYALEYAVSMGVGFVLTLIVWPETYNDIFREDRARQAFSDVTSGTPFAESLKEYLEIINRDVLSGYGCYVIGAVLIMVIVVVLFRLIGKNQFVLNIVSGIPILSISIAVALYVAMIARIAPLRIDRYVFNVYPLIVLVISCLLVNSFDIMAVNVTNGKSNYLTFAIVTLVSCVIIVAGYVKYGVNYLYLGDRDKTQYMYQNRQVPVVMVTDDNRRYFSCVNSYYVRFSENVYPVMANSILTTGLGMEKFEEEPSEILLFVDKQIEDDTVFDEICMQFKYDMDIIPIFTTEEATVYMVTRSVN